jgi:hypothetical protein
MLRTLMKMKTAFGHHLVNSKERKTKTSRLPTVLSAQASVLRYCFFERYDTQSPEGYDATIALARVTESEALCRRLEKAGWTIHVYDDAVMNIHSAVLEAISSHFAPGILVKHVGCISGRGIRTLSEAGFSTTAHAIPDKNTENRHFHPISDVLPSREVVF